MNSTHVRELVDHLAWADAAVWRTILSSPSLLDDVKIRERIHHLQATENAFLLIWKEKPVDIPRLDSFEDLAALQRWNRTVIEEVSEYMSRLDEQSALERIVNIPWAARYEKFIGAPARPVTLGQSMVQVAMHSHYHRGQVNARMRELGVDPPHIDYIIWLWIGKPKATWPVEVEATPA